MTQSDIIAMLERGDMGGALAGVDALLATTPDDVRLRELRISILLSLHRYDDALDALRTETRRRPHSTEMWLSLAQLAMQLGMRDEVDTAMHRLRQLRPSDQRAVMMIDAYFSAHD